jgi:hypothetical protein
MMVVPQQAPNTVQQAGAVRISQLSYASSSAFSDDDSELTPLGTPTPDQRLVQNVPWEDASSMTQQTPDERYSSPPRTLAAATVGSPIGRSPCFSEGEEEDVPATPRSVCMSRADTASL